MASVNWKKMTSAEVSGMYLHLDQNARLTHEHSNKDIQKELTPKNYIIGANSFKDAVKCILALQEYCGDVVNFKTHVKSYRVKKQIRNPEEMWAMRTI